MTSSEILGGTFYGTKIPQNGRTEALGLVRHVTGILLKREDLNQSFPKMSELGDTENKLVKLKRITDGGLGEEPPTAGQFFEKK